MSCASRVAMVDLSYLTVAGFLDLPTAAEDGQPSTQIRVIDSVICNMVDGGTGVTTTLTIGTVASAFPILQFGKTFSPNEADTFTFHFPHGLPIYDADDFNASGVSNAPPQEGANGRHALRVSMTSGVTSGLLTIAYHWAARAQLG